jgi:nicotinamide-nucleotide amidase
MNVEVITIGDELLIGQVVDTNAAWMGQVLNDAGFRVSCKTSVGDVEQDMLDAFDASFKRSSIVLVTGGIGPTKDDITKRTLCKFFNTSMVLSPDVLSHIESLFVQSGRAMNPLTHDQAYVPIDCTVIQNQMGTAPITWFERNGKVLVSMPGVPYEMKWAMINEVLPRLKSLFLQDEYIQHHTLLIKGFSESALAIFLDAFEQALPEAIKLAYLPTPGLIRLRLSGYYGDEQLLTSWMLKAVTELKALLQGSVIADEDKSIPELIGALLQKQGLMLGTAESCTGGKIAEMITSIAGSSTYFAGGVVSYSNAVKHQLLGVKNETLDCYGAVSREVVEEMVLGAQRVLGCACAIAVSGIAGPTGGTTEKPVGFVWISVACNDKLHTESFQFGKNREQNIQRSANMSLLMLKGLLEN